MKIPALALLDQEHWDNVYGQTERKRLEALVSPPFGAMAVDEFERYLRGDFLHGEVREEMMQTIA